MDDGNASFLCNNILVLPVCKYGNTLYVVAGMVYSKDHQEDNKNK